VKKNQEKSHEELGLSLFTFHYTQKEEERMSQMLCWNKINPHCTSNMLTRHHSLETQREKCSQQEM
jgi:hypothetical protein